MRVETPERGLRGEARRLRNHGQLNGNGGRPGKVEGERVYRRLATENVGTLAGRAGELVAWMHEQEVETMCLQEHRMNGHLGERADVERIATGGGYRVMWGAERTGQVQEFQ